jgi:hypothetical protein
MRKRLRKLSVFQTAKVAAVLYGVLGLVVAPFIFLAGTFLPGEARGAGLFGGLLGALVLPVVYAVVGFIGTAIACVIYNVLAGITGGIEFELEDVSSY